MKFLPFQVLFLVATFSVFAQAPSKFSYQAVAINANGTELKNTQVCIRASIIKNIVTGLEDWIEVHPTVTTDTYGLFTIEIGGGNPIGGAVNSFDKIKWGESKFFLRIEMSMNTQCSNYSLVGTNQLLSVPYALYSPTSGTATSAVHAQTADLANIAQKANSASKADSANYAATAKAASTAATALDDLDKDPTNELQTLSLNDKTISLSKANSITIDVRDGDSDSTNEIQNLSFTNNVLSLSKSSAVIDFNNLAGFNAAGSDLDFPQGIATSQYVFKPDTMRVPAGQVFYVTASENEMFLPGLGSSFGRHWTSPNLPVFKSGTYVEKCRCIGFYKPVDQFVDAQIIVLRPNQSNFYQVPVGKRFVIKSGLNVNTPITLDGYTLSPFSALIKALVIPPTTQIRNLSSDEIILTGYLINN